MQSMYMSPSAATVTPAMASMAAAPTVTSVPGAVTTVGYEYARAAPAVEAYSAPAGTTIAAPAIETVTAAPVTIAAPTTLTAQVAAAPMAMPMAATVAAPPATMVVNGTPSYVAPPVVRALNDVVQPVAPPNLTSGLPDPASIEQQKAAYAKGLDTQLAQAMKTIEEQAAIEKQMIKSRMDTQLAQYQLQVEEQTKMQLMQVDQKVQAQVKQLWEAAATQKTALEEQAAVATMEYRKKKALEEQGLKSYQVQKKYYEEEMRLMEQYKQVAQRGAMSTAGTAL